MLSNVVVVANEERDKKENDDQTRKNTGKINASDYVCDLPQVNVPEIQGSPLGILKRYLFK